MTFKVSPDLKQDFYLDLYEYGEDGLDNLITSIFDHHKNLKCSRCGRDDGIISINYCNLCVKSKKEI